MTRTTEKSYMDYIFIVNNSVIIWSIHKQHTVVFFNMELEYIVLFDAAHEAIVWKKFL